MQQSPKTTHFSESFHIILCWCFFLSCNLCFHIHIHVWDTHTHMYITPLFLLQSFHKDEQPNHSQIQEAASTIVSMLSKRHNSTVMLAVIEVKVEMPVMSQPVGEWNRGQLASRLKPAFNSQPSVNSPSPSISAVFVSHRRKGY